MFDLRRLFKRPPIKQVCLEIENFEEVDRQDPTCLERLKSALASEGALTVKIDYRTKLWCVSIERPDLTVEKIIHIMRKFGYKAQERRPSRTK